MGGLGKEGDQFHIVNFAEDTGEHQVVDETTVMAIFVAPVPCEIIDIGLAVTGGLAAAGSNHVTIQIVNHTGDLNLLSTAFDTDSGNSGNGGRSLTDDKLTSLCDNGAGTNYLQNAVLAKGDMLILTSTDGGTTTLNYPVIVVRYRT